MYKLIPYNEDYKEFVYQVKKDAYLKYVEHYWGPWNEEEQRKFYENFINQVKDETDIILLDDKEIGFYNGLTLDDGAYEVGNICIIEEYQGKGIGTEILKDKLEQHKEHDIHIQYFKINPVGKLYERLGFIPNGETDYHYQMIKPKEKVK